MMNIKEKPSYIADGIRSCVLKFLLRIRSGKLIRRVRKFFALSWRDRYLFIKVFGLTGVVRLAIHGLPFRWLAPTLGKHMRESALQEDITNLEIAKHVGLIIEMVSRYTPWESKCLVQAIVGKIILRQCGITNTLYLGVRRDRRQNIIAHAWLRCGDTILTGNRGITYFRVVSKFADDW